jgi:hypothetical protein
MATAGEKHGRGGIIGCNQQNDIKDIPDLSRICI